MDKDEELVAELRAMLHEMGVVPRDLTPLPGQEERMERELVRILAMPREGDGAPPPSVLSVGRRRLWKPVSALGAAAAVIVALILVLQPGPVAPKAQAGTPPMLRFEFAPDGGLPRQGEPATRELLRLAAARSGAQSVGVGRVQHVVLDAWWSSSIDDGSGVVTSLIPVHQDSYFFPDATVRHIERRGQPLTKAGRIDDSGARPEAPVSSDDTFEYPEPGPGYAAELSTDPTMLRATLSEGHDPPTCGDREAACFVSDMVGLHLFYVVPPDLTAAFWELLAGEPEVTYLGATTDRLGREAVAFTAPALDRFSQVVILADPETGEFLGDEQVLIEPSELAALTPPAVTSFTGVLEASFVRRSDVPD